ncbi:hypothetical protein [Metapseudomonas otitidis]|uniref:hypothetical protein n=1 Tax=Metapseudomonas otitidis TaxID=319939 RepID=UPI0013DFF46C|nr:hypothetical protein [Pseudomonas otitidis]
MIRKQRELGWDGVALVVSVACLALVVVKSLELPVWSMFLGTLVESILTSKSIKALVDVLCGGVVAAYVFYLMVEKFPARRKEEQSIRILDELLGTLMESYKSGSVFMHELPIDEVELTPEEMAILANEAVVDIKNRKYNDYLKLWSPIRTADSRYSDICHALSLTALLSPAHTRQWLKITDRVRLMREEYYRKPVDMELEIIRDIQSVGHEQNKNNETALHVMSLEARVLEFMRDVRDWGKLNDRLSH